MKPQRRSSKCAIVNRAVSFNVEDPYQAELLKRSQQYPNFSAAVKRWLASLDGKKENAIPPLPVIQNQIATQDMPKVEFDPVSELF